MKRLCVLFVLVLPLVSCAELMQQVSQPKPPVEAKTQGAAAISHTCPFRISADVDGVLVQAGSRPLWKSSVSGELAGELPCKPQILTLSKACYPDARIAFNPSADEEIHLDGETWEKYGYLRVENASKSDVIEIRNLPGETLSVPPGEHVVHQLPLGDYEAIVAAEYKMGIPRSFRLCSEDEIYSLKVDALDAEGDLLAQGEQSVTLRHGRGRVRVVTLESNVDFRIAPDRSEALSAYIKQKRIREILTVPVEKIPEPLRRAVELLRYLDSQEFKAPACITLPAGEYFLTHSLQEKGADRVPLQVQPDSETRIDLPDFSVEFKEIPADVMEREDLCM